MINFNKIRFLTDLDRDPALGAVCGDGGEDDELDGVQLHGVERGVGLAHAEQLRLHVLDVLLFHLKEKIFWKKMSNYFL